MKKIITLFISFINIALFTVGCNNSNEEIFNIEELTLKEARKIVSTREYNLKTEEPKELDILIGYSDTYDKIKVASLHAGYNEEDFNTMTRDRQIFSYELVEKSQLNEGDKTLLCILVDKEKAIGAYLCSGNFISSIDSLDF